MTKSKFHICEAVGAFVLTACGAFGLDAWAGSSGMAALGRVNSAHRLEGHWVIEEIDGRSADPRKEHIFFNDGLITAEGICNRAWGTYKIGPTLEMSLSSQTSAACFPVSKVGDTGNDPRLMMMEKSIFDVLNSRAQYKFRANTLLLKSTGNASLLLKKIE